MLFLPAAVRFDVVNTDLSNNRGCKLHAGFSVDGETGWMTHIDVTDDIQSYDTTFSPGIIMQDRYELAMNGDRYCDSSVREGGCENIFDRGE